MIPEAAQVEVQQMMNFLGLGLDFRNNKEKYTTENERENTLISVKNRRTGLSYFLTGVCISSGRYPH